MSILNAIRTQLGMPKEKGGAFSDIKDSAKKLGEGVKSRAKAAGSFIQRKAKNIGQSTKGVMGMLGVPMGGGGGYDDGLSPRSRAANKLRTQKSQAGSGQVQYRTKEPKA